MEMTRELRLFASVAAIMTSGLVLSGCIGGPTYGTDKSAGEQLIDDLGSAVSFTPTKRDPVKYQPRPGLVLPPTGQQTALVEPQKSLASREANPEWVESPEEARNRLREEADANKDNPNYVSPLAKASANGRRLSAKEQQQAYRDARKIEMGAYADKRRFLSDPPLEYRRLPEASEADLGEPEKLKERRRKKEAQIKNSGSKWYWPF
ncbi:MULTISPECIES: hypothetical protein [Ensifer]|jgi:hypothetical protein|uniref:Lipoprotein n=1 Tax=Ensifer canadensis TaxID=555315 RepID=A0AAW4FIR3_9HYPH|nr:MULTISPECIES: hypothetical protein [Ensifer]AHK43538.1 hypothetical protein OV14_1729 [Ensifer adhaerens OV14]MDP9628266.1 hypothetical protein [Ensifer adhaerens]KQU71739.1 hypothetical protein ASD00_16720 [Ensifer sp. Root31]KQW62634.1 hypothetical protein ASD02_00415 [Ensifer sp. Root1252]KQW84750.1 hypothetical protein ASD03_03160 [Ensifer sp. Root127]